MKTHRVFNRLSKFIDVCYRKNKCFYDLLYSQSKLISTKKNLLQNLTRFHDSLFELEIPESFTSAFLLKAIIRT